MSGTLYSPRIFRRANFITSSKSFYATRLGGFHFVFFKSCIQIVRPTLWERNFLQKWWNLRVQRFLANTGFRTFLSFRFFGAVVVSVKMLRTVYLGLHPGFASDLHTAWRARKESAICLLFIFLFVSRTTSPFHHFLHLIKKLGCSN